MSTRTIQMTDTLYNYYRNVAYREPDIMRMLREETETMPMARMQISPEQGQFLAMLVALTGAKKILEVGTFTGYSSLWMASSLPEDGKIT
ncbi:MAG TPA: SAM-dependent methyltransferase, partial [Myxococcales bacterium]|nr:SAM-dependent methyltransferase [Myxococcales bacterium]